MAMSPKGPCKCMVYTWDLKGFLNSYLGVYVGTIMIVGPFGKDITGQILVSSSEVTLNCSCCWEYTIMFLNSGLALL